MRLATIRIAGSTRAARVEGDSLVVLQAPDVATLLAAGGIEGAASAAATGERVAIEEADFATLVPRPWKFICVGLNYKSHILEGSNEFPSHPTFFSKFPEALIGARDDIVIPAAAPDMVDWEAELGVVVGKPVRNADSATARDAIAGYTVVNDTSMRDFQRRTLQWLQGKTFEHASPVGPWLVTTDELNVTDEGVDHRLQCLVDGEVMQDAPTGDLLFGPIELVRYASQIVTLKPGDIISTGTTGGVGAARTPAVFLKPGQVVTTRIEGIGELVNRCISEADFRA
ncbi:MAG: fumarylacetoacetate hydrolase family protein [Acidimicrobiia bacterium]